MKKIIVAFIFLICVANCFCITTEFDKDGLIVNGYGNRKYTDGQVVSFDYFSGIRLFSAIQLDNWNIVKQELDSGIGVDWKVIVVESKYNMKLVYTPLIFAVMNGKDKIARKLIGQGAGLEDSVVSFVNGNEQMVVLKDLIFQNVLMTKTIPSDFLVFYLDKRLESNLLSEYNEALYMYSGIYSNSEIFIKMLWEHLCYIDEQVENGTVELSKEEIIQEQIITRSIPMIIYGCIFSESIQNKTECVSSCSMEAILNLIQTPFCSQHIKEISAQFKQKIMPEADKKFSNDDGYQAIRKMFLVFCEQ